jgi:anti-sigma regulatory factor (Ser/Thr protein kinase)
VNERRTVVPGDATQLPLLTSFLREFWANARLPSAQASNFELALEEVFMNIVMHGSRPAITPRVEVSLALSAGALTMTVEDDGPPFDPLALPLPDVTASLADRRVGGLGVFLVRRVMDHVAYQRCGPCNRLTMSKTVAS